MRGKKNMSRTKKEKKNEEVLQEEQNAVEVEETVEDVETVETVETEAPVGEVNPLQAELDAANAKTAEYLALAQRVQADFENYRRRNESVRADSYAEGRRDVATQMLSVLDNLERAMAAAGNSTDDALKNGVEMVLRQMNDVYKKLEVTAIDRQGEKFDPNLENAVLQGSPDEGEPGTVCQVLQKGYKMGDRVLRHAMVKVVPE